MGVFVRTLRLAAACFLVSMTVPAAAQQALPLPDVDLAAAGFVNALARQADGGTIVAGSFTTFDGLPRPGLARLRPDGTTDADWAPAWSLYNYIFTLAIDADGNIYAGGRFGVAKLTAAGQVDPSFQAWSSDLVERVALDGNGHVYAVGNALTQIGGRPAAGIARLDAGTGAADAGWTLSARANGQVNAIAVDGDSLYVGGYFDTIGGETRRSLAKLTNTGSVDATWNPATDGEVYALALGGTSLYVSGGFGTIGSQSIPGFARVSRSGTGDADPNWRPVDTAAITRLAFDGAGHLYANGVFNISGSDFFYGVGRFSVATAATNPERAAQVRVVAWHPDGGMIIGGEFHRAGAFGRRHVARIAANGDVDPACDPSPDGDVRAVAVDDAGLVYVGGSFSSIGELDRRFLARISNGGAVDPDWAG